MTPADWLEGVKGRAWGRAGEECLAVRDHDWLVWYHVALRCGALRKQVASSAGVCLGCGSRGGVLWPEEAWLEGRASQREPAGWSARVTWRNRAGRRQRSGRSSA